MKFQVTFEVENDDDGANLSEEQFVESIEEEAEFLLMEQGYSNIECKLVD